MREDQEEARQSVYLTADGLSAEDCRKRAAVAFEWANECRAKYPGLLNTPRRERAIAAAAAWVSILRFIDYHNMQAFTMDEYLTLSGPPRKRSWLPSFLDFPVIISGIRDALGTSPRPWYEGPLPGRDGAP